MNPQALPLLVFILFSSTFSPLLAGPGFPFSRIVMPTDRGRLDPSLPGVFQPTAAGTVESALYGSVRTGQVGRHLYATFHEGIDIAPLQRSAKGVPLDVVRAVAGGVVGYANYMAGNSNYGKYVVLLHQDPCGTVYTLYAHLAAISPELRVGQPVEAGQRVGTMGHTSSSPIPLARAHLHFEVGLIANERFGIWYRARKLKPDHGLFNGQNLLALSPLLFFNNHEALATKGFRQILSQVPPAFTLLVPSSRNWDYFRRYPGLWQGPPFQGGWMVISCSENGTVLSGRNATPDEQSSAKPGKSSLIDVDDRVIGRNGCRLVVNDRGRWRLGEKGIRWLEILGYQ